MRIELRLAEAMEYPSILTYLEEAYEYLKLEPAALQKSWEQWRQQAAIEFYWACQDDDKSGLLVFDRDNSTVMEIWVIPSHQGQGLEVEILDELLIKENLISCQVWEEDRKRYNLMVDYGFRPTRRSWHGEWQVVKMDLSTAVLLEKIKNLNIAREYRDVETVAIESVADLLQYDEIKNSLAILIEKLGGLERYVKPGQTVVIKPNLVSDHGLKKDGTVVGGVVTDIKVVKAMVELLLPFAGQVIIAEGSSINRSATTRMFAHYGYDEVVALDPERVRLVDLNTDQLIEKTVPGGKRMHSRRIPVTLDIADVIISMPVMKIHFAAIVSLSIKNLQGAVPPLEKYMSHFFGLWQNLVNINHLVKPDLIIIDGTTAQEDFGPISGIPKPMNLLIGGTNPVAVDAVAMRIMGFDPTESPPVLLAHLQGFGPIASQNINVLGPDPATLCDAFKRPEIDLASGQDVLVHSSKACPGCKGYLHFALSKLRKPDPLFPERLIIDRPFEQKVNIYLGPGLEQDIDPQQNNIFVGLCQQHHAGLGVHLPGCPPHSEVLIDGIFRLFPDVPKAKYADKSEEATLGEMLDKILAGLNQEASQQ